MLVLAFSLQDQVETYGAYVGVGAFVGLAVLSLLYFAQAREVKRLRDWAGRAPERAQELEARVTALAEDARPEPEPEPEPVPERSGTVGPARPIEQPTVATPPPSANGHQEGVPAPVPMGPRPAVAAAALAAAAVPVAAKAAEAPVAEGATAAPAETDAPAEDDAAPAPQETPAPAPPQQPAGAPGGAPTGPRREPPPIPRATPRPSPRRPAPAAPLRTGTGRSTTVAPRRGMTAAAGRRPPAPAPKRSSGTSAGRIAAFTVIGLVVLGGLGFGATRLFGGEDATPAPNRPTEASNGSEAAAGDGDGGASGGGEAAENRADTVVAVLNGTPVEGLASESRDALIAEGYSDAQGMIRTGNSTDQQRQDSTILYREGERVQARDVGAILDIDGLEPLDADTQSVADGADQTGSGVPSDVVVVLGADQSP